MPATHTTSIEESNERTLALAHEIGREVAAIQASDVDAKGRFPSESIEALREAGLLGALVPTAYGGGGVSYGTISAICTELGRHCASTAMIYAMHQIQVACLVEHGEGQPHFRDLMREVAVTGRLIASATTEAGIGGDVRSSSCAVVTDGDRFTLEKNASVISYGEYVDDVFVTARRNPDAAANDQVLVHVTRPGLELDPNGTWDAFGMRGTCSIGFMLRASGSTDQVLGTPYADVSSRTMLPVSHITWSSLWLGIAEDALRKARSYVQKAARKDPGTVPPTAERLARLQAQVDRLRAMLTSAILEFEASRTNPALAESLNFAVHMNNLKVSMSQGVLGAVQDAMTLCGIAAYRNDTPHSLGRQLRDAHSAELMVHNDRILGHNASLLCLMKES